MTTYLCQACGTQYPPADAPPAACPICEDPRQYIPVDTGQVWAAWGGFIDGPEADGPDGHGGVGIGGEPSVAIGQRALLVKSRAGNVLWDCTPYIDGRLVDRIGADGGVAAMAISHPHYYSSM